VKFLKRPPDFVPMRHLVLSFRSILRRGRTATLKPCIKEAENAGSWRSVDSPGTG
jgi:hypothetical protein